MSQAVGIVIPAYRPDVEVLSTYLRELDERVSPGHVRVELDAPAPGVVKSLSAVADDLEASLTVSTVDHRRGKGMAITAGFEALARRGDVSVLAFVDADGSTPASEAARVLEPVRTHETDLAVGSRRHPDATVKAHETVGRRLLGDAFAWSARRVLDVQLYDYQCGAKAVSIETWTGVRDHLYEAGFGWDVELVAIAGALDRRIVEVPVEWTDRPGSTVSPLRDAIRLARTLLDSRTRARRVAGRRTMLADGYRTLRSFARPPRTPLVDRLEGEIHSEGKETDFEGNEDGRVGNEYERMGGEDGRVKKENGRVRNDLERVSSPVDPVDSGDR